ncbi:MAG: sigma-70 family RNA polymerase sigma factor [Clostridia bacterium]|nr:sigma-70 family RNA polymerase sigma factor [Clostridia bacterium]
MPDTTNKQLAPTVVLASHGNKNACRELYIHYYKNIFFICNSITGNVSLASKITAQVFIRMFESLDKLGDHNDFEQWFYSLTISICSHNAPEMNGGLVDNETVKLAKEASEAAAAHNNSAFERSVVRILERMIICLPPKARTLLFYNNFACLDVSQTALLEKKETEETKTQIDAVEKLIEKQVEKIKTYGVDISMFTSDMTSTLRHMASKIFVPESIHNEVSEKLGVNVSPYSSKKTEKPEKKDSEKTVQKKETEEEKQKFRLTKSDFILFFSIIAVVLIICSVAAFFLNSKDNKDNAQTTVSQQTNEKPALLWNGAAASSFDGGNGSEENPFRIATGGQLAYLANLINEGNSYYAACSYILTADIIINETDDFASWGEVPPENRWTPVGSSTNDDSYSYFSGTFDGNGHTISGMYVTGKNDYSGLFGVSRNALFKNVTLVDSYVDGGSYTGGICGYYAADTKEMSGFESCAFSGKVKSDGNNAGGITGYFRAEGDKNTTFISGCCVNGSVEAVKGYAGGITGASEADTGSVIIKNCFNTAVVKSAKNAGGITGDSRAADGVAIIDCTYNTGIVSAEENEGGISGIINCTEGEGRVNIQNCYMLDSSCPVTVTRGTGDERLVVGNITILNINEMAIESSFNGFDFETIWKTTDGVNNNLPVLKSVNDIYWSFSETESYSF